MIKALIAIARWIFGDEALMDLVKGLVAVVVVLVVTVFMTSVWALSLMAQPGGMWWLALNSSAARGALSAPGVPRSLSVAAPGVAPAPIPYAPVSSWIDGPPYNQFSRSVWRTTSTFDAWAPAACSAAALAWMLRAYGRPVSALDDAVVLLSGNISTQLGLLDHRGPALAAVLARQGLSSWDLHLSSTADLVTALSRGPVMLGGDKWFGVGHWFVAVGADAGGIAVRESSGHDIRYLNWQQLYGPVGWSGWAVGVGAGLPPNQAILAALSL